MIRRLAALLSRILGRVGRDRRPEQNMAPMLDCESVMRQLWDYLDGELTVDRRTAIRSHIELCKRCYPQYEFEQAFLAAIAASAPSHAHPDRLRRNLLAALEKEGFSAA